MNMRGIGRLSLMAALVGCGDDTSGEGTLGETSDTDSDSDSETSSDSDSMTDTSASDSDTDSATGTTEPTTDSDPTTDTSASDSDTDTTTGADPDTSDSDDESSSDDDGSSSSGESTDASSSSESSSGGDADDGDGDGVVDDDDNCPDDPNPQQEDDDLDDIGNVCDNDADNDNLPDGDDPFPDDPNLPGVVLQARIYAHTSSQLYTMEVEPPYNIALVGNFSFPNGSAGQVTDVAIDQFGVLYAVTFNDFFVCDPDNAACYYLGDLPESHNALTFVPPGTVDPNDDALIGIANSGSWRHLELNGNQVMLSVLGQYGGGYTSSGDSFSIDGVGTYSSVNDNNGFTDVIVEVDPLTGMVLNEIATLNPYTSTYGLAGWEGAIFAFDEGGDVLLIDPNSGTVEVINDTAQTWWGAGVGTILPQ